MKVGAIGVTMVSSCSSSCEWARQARAFSVSGVFRVVVMSQLVVRIRGHIGQLGKELSHGTGNSEVVQR